MSSPLSAASLSKVKPQQGNCLWDVIEKDELGAFAGDHVPVDLEAVCESYMNKQQNKSDGDMCEAAAHEEGAESTNAACALCDGKLAEKVDHKDTEGDEGHSAQSATPPAKRPKVMHISSCSSIRLTPASSHSTVQYVSSASPSPVEALFQTPSASSATSFSSTAT